MDWLVLMLSLAPAPVKARQIIRKPLNGRRLVFTPARGDSIREHLHVTSSRKPNEDQQTEE